MEVAWTSRSITASIESDAPSDQIDWPGLMDGDVATFRKSFDDKKNSSSDTMTDAAIAAELVKADLVVCLEWGSETSSLEKICPTYKGAKDSWSVSAPSVETAPEILKQLAGNISSLMVRLILQGGKRKPLASDVPSKGGDENSKEHLKSAVRVSLDKKGRKGKKVTVISGLRLSDQALEELGTKLKQRCGTGGTVKDSCIEIQGDQRDKVMNELSNLGYKPKKSGG